jgi:hypothetical protein
MEMTNCLSSKKSIKKSSQSPVHGPKLLSSLLRQNMVATENKAGNSRDGDCIVSSWDRNERQLGCSGDNAIVFARLSGG